MDESAGNDALLARGGSRETVAVMDGVPFAHKVEKLIEQLSGKNQRPVTPDRRIDQILPIHESVSGFLGCTRQAMILLGWASGNVRTRDQPAAVDRDCLALDIVGLVAC